MQKRWRDEAAMYASGEVLAVGWGGWWEGVAMLSLVVVLAVDGLLTSLLPPLVRAPSIMNLTKNLASTTHQLPAHGLTISLVAQATTLDPAARILLLHLNQDLANRNSSSLPLCPPVHQKSCSRHMIFYACLGYQRHRSPTPSSAFTRHLRPGAPRVFF